MSVTEAQRLQLFKKLEESLGGEDATTMMTMLPPVGWADVATKHDLDGLESRLRLEMATTDDCVAIRLELHEQTTRFIGWVLASNAALAGVFGTLIAFG